MKITDEMVTEAMKACIISPEIPTGVRAHLVHQEGVLVIREQVDLQVVIEKVLEAALAVAPKQGDVRERLINDLVGENIMLLEKIDRLRAEIAAEIEADLEDGSNGIKHLYYVEGMKRAIEIARNGR